MKLLIDMNLSPGWAPLLAAHGWESCHWSTIGPVNAPDSALMQWAREHQHVVMTQDLDFSQILYTTRRAVPVWFSCAWTMNLMTRLGSHVCEAIALAESAFSAGALLMISGRRVRLRHLPFSPAA